MIVPFLKGRIEQEFNLYLKEHSASVTGSIGEARRNSKEARLLFSRLFPLFVLLRVLTTPNFTRDPSRDVILSELRDAGNKQRFSEALAHFSHPRPFYQELVSGFQRQIFTGYFDELFSDSLLLLNSYYTYNYRSAMIAIRCMLEDLYRHLFYRDHPQEFAGLVSSRRSEYEMGLTPGNFRKYLAKTDYLQIYTKLDTFFAPKIENEMDLFGLNEKLYSECSGSVHGSSAVTLNAFRSNADLTRNEAREQQVLSVAQDFTKIAISFLIAAHMDHFLAANEYERSMILSSSTDNERAAFRRALNI